MPTNKNFDRKNPRKKYEGEQGIDTENYPYHGPAPPRFEPRRTSGRSGEPEASIVGVPGSGRVGLDEPRVVQDAMAEPEITVDPLNVAPNHRSYPWYRRDNRTIEALQESVVLNIDVAREGVTYYVKRIGHNFFDNDVEVRLEVDGRVWNRWDFHIGGVAANGMYDLHSALAARSRIKMIVRNLAAQTRLYECAMDGWYAETAGVSERKGGFD